MSQTTIQRGVMTFYSDATDAAGHAVRFVLAEKAINVETNIVAEGERPEELNDLNPYGGVLTLVDRELALYEEHIIMEYLDERFPHPPLMPVDPVSRANNRLFRYRIKRDIYDECRDLDPSNAAPSATKRKVVRDHLTAIAPIFGQKPYFMSDEFSLVDCYLVPILWRLPYYAVQLPAQARPLLQYAERMFERESFQASLTEAEQEMR